LEKESTLIQKTLTNKNKDVEKCTKNAITKSYITQVKVKLSL
jgi:hypothetical protein